MNDVVRLSDGSPATIRPIVPEDRSTLLATFDALSPESRYRRFLRPTRELSGRTLDHLLDVDERDRVALLAQDGRTGAPLGVARYARSTDDPEEAEIAVAVVDRAQGKCLGTALMHRLAERAQAAGIARFTGLVLTDNQPSLALLRDLGTPRTHPTGSGTIAVTVQLALDEGIPHLRGWLRAAASEAVDFTVR